MSDRTSPDAPFLVLNGPNLNMLGVRQPQHYGHHTLADVEDLCQKTAAELGVRVMFFQSNDEGAMIDRIHQARGNAAGIVINAGGWTHTSVAPQRMLAQMQREVAGRLASADGQQVGPA